MNTSNSFFFPTIWVTVASVHSEAAAAVAYIQVFPKKENDDGGYKAAGAIDLERFQATQLFRFNVHNEDGSLLTSLPLAVDSVFTVDWRKVKGKTSSRGMEITITFEEGFKEECKKLVIRMPYDGVSGTAMLVVGTCEHAGRVVTRAVDVLQAIEHSMLMAPTTPVAPVATPKTVGMGTIVATGGSDLLSPMSIG
jgi:hypothetical protein